MSRFVSRFGMFFRNIFFSPKKELKQLYAVLKPVRDELEKLRVRTDGINVIVPFFNLTSPVQDSNPVSPVITRFKERNWRGQYDGVISILESVQAHFSNAGRCRYGWNRTGPGEAVTEDQVYLGDVWGLFTKTVSFWKQKKDEPKGGWGYRGMEHLNAYDVVNNQAREFIQSHMPVIELIDNLRFVG